MSIIGNNRTAQPRRLAVVFVVMSVLFATIQLFLVPAFAQGEPVHVSTTFEGCRGSTGSFPALGPFICPDAQYTSGNLGQGWHELDRVPHRLTTSLGLQDSASTSYKINITADYWEAGHPGYDIISAPVVNAGKSHASCAVSSTAQDTLIPGIGGTDKSIYRTLTINQDKGSTCVFDWNERLALGSHLYPGSSLHSNLTQEDFTTGGVGARDISIPVREILPQELRKDMSATQGSEHSWTLNKSSNPGTLNFANTCDTSAGAREGTVTVTVSWERLAASPSGEISVVTHVFAKNPAHRQINVNVTDKIYSGTTLLDTKSVSNVPVASGSEVEVLSHSMTVPAGTANLNDVATATYIDPANPSDTIPGSTTATASATVQSTGTTSNESAVITDTESITGAGLSFKVTNVSGASGSFGGGYALGTSTTGPLTWTSSSQSGSGSVTFTKVVTVDQPRITSGTLSDRATLNGSDGFGPISANASTSISASASVTLTITKVIPNILSGSETETFTFDVSPGSSFNAGNVVSTKTIAFSAGQTQKSVNVSGLAPGTYTVHERPAAGWVTPADRTVTIDLPNCSGEAVFNNNSGGASARVKKVSDPAGEEAGWEFTLTGPGTPSGGEKATTTGSGFVFFTSALQEGEYTVTETLKSGWDQTSSEGCTFTVDYPADASRVFSCTFTNVQRGTIIIEKQTDPNGSTATFDYTGDVAGTLSDGQSTSASVQPGTYNSTEAAKAGWKLTGLVCDDEDSTGDVASRTATFNVTAGETVKCTFTNTQLGSITIVKDAQADSAQDFSFVTSGDGLSNFSLDDDADATLSNTKQFSDLMPGTYTVTEEVTFGWKLASVVCSTGGSVSLRTATMVLPAGGNITCTYTNVELLPAIDIVKTVSPESGSPGDTVVYTFVVTNIGNTTLFNVSVDDDKLGHIGDIPVLEVGQSVTLTKEATLGTTSVTNVATAEGADEFGRKVSDQDDAVVTVVLPAKIELPVTGAMVAQFLVVSMALMTSGALLIDVSRRRQNRRRFIRKPEDWY